MDDLISRKDLLNNMRAGCIPLDEPEISGLIGDRETIRSYIVNAPSIPAVPLEPLCDWFANKAKLPAPCYYVESYCPYNDFGHCELDAPDLTECWEYVLTKWMEGLDAAD